MTRGEALKDFFRKTILPVASAALLYCIFRSACVKNGELDYLWLWILCGLPFGIWRLRLWIIPGGGSLGGGIALFLLNFVFAGLIGGFPQHRPAWPFAHNPTAPTTAAAAKIAFPDRKNHHFMVEWG